MGRFRIFNHDVTVSSSDLNQRINGNEMMKYLRTKAPSKKDSNVIVDYNKLEVVYFKSYQEFINATRSYLKNNPNCYQCADTPSSIVDGKNSEICYDELYKHIKDCTLDYCNQCEKILKMNDCLEGMFPYGHFNNENPEPVFSFPAKVKIDECGEKKKCPQYVYCKCPPNMTQKCCYYDELFPSQFSQVNLIKDPSNPGKSSCPERTIKNSIHAYSVFPRIKAMRKKQMNQPKLGTSIKKPRTITKYNKELRKYETIELSI